MLHISSRQMIRNALIVWALGCGTAAAQNSSLYHQVKNDLTLASAAITYENIEPFRTIKLNDHVTVAVTESDEVISSANLQRRKTLSLDAVLNNWVKIQNGSLKLTPQEGGDPEVQGQYNGNVRSTANLATNDSIKFRITTSVKDIRPNGHLVLEGHTLITDNDEEWDYSVSGECDPLQIRADGTVLSERLADKVIKKRNRGTVRDGYRRGWAFKFLDNYGAF